MKTFNKFVVLSLSGMLMLSSCKSTEKFNVYAPAGSQVALPYSSGASAIVPAGNDNSVKFIVPSDMYLGYYVVKDPASGLEVPYGMNVKRKSSSALRAAAGFGYGLSMAGATTMLMGTVLVCAASADEDDYMNNVGLGLVGGGAAASLAGIGIGLPSSQRAKQLAKYYQFAYDSDQHADISGLSATLSRTDPPKGQSAAEGTNSRRGKGKAVSEKTPVTTSSAKAKKSVKDFAKIVAGTYNGKGKLLQSGSVEEEYADVIIKIERVDKTHVRVTVIEGGEDFFESPVVYVVTKGKKGYVLKMQDGNASEIVINEATAKYRHSRVNIDDEIFTLQIDAYRK